MKTNRFVAAVVAAAVTTILAGAGPTQAVPPEDYNCVTPGGDNLNELFGISQRIIGPPACREAFAGERWFRSAPGWVTAASGADAVYPDGYTPAEPNPIDDFNAKFAGARVVHDIGTKQERTFIYSADEILRPGFVGADGLPFSGLLTPELHPLSVGKHSSTVFITMSAEHCDGLDVVVEFNCIPVGETQWTGDTPVEFFPRRG